MNPRLLRLLSDLEGVGTSRVKLALLAYEKAGEAGLPATYSEAENDDDAFRLHWDVNGGFTGAVTTAVFDDGVVWSFANWATEYAGSRGWFSDRDPSAEVPPPVKEFIKAHFTR